jgi:Tol biopolymer transport system component
MTTPYRLGHFDKTVLLVMAGIILATLAFVWRGDQVGLQVVRLSPAGDSQQVSTQAVIRVTFSQAIMPQTTVSVASNPPITGTARWENERTLVFEPAAQLAQDTTYAITIPAGLVGQQGRELLRPFTWQFRTGQPRLLFIAWDEARSGNQLFVISPDGSGRAQLTQEPLNVLDYAIAPDGQTIAYTATRNDGGSNLWLMDAIGANRRELLACPEGACSQPVWAPDASRLIYERRTFSQPGAPVGPPRLWWLELNTRQTTAVFQDSQWVALGAQFSADGQWLSYISPQAQDILVYNLVTGQNIILNNGSGEPASWHPLQNILLASQVKLEEEAFSIHLTRLNLSDETTMNLSGDLDVNDSWPLFSPDGQWIAFTRKAIRANEGKQVWLMRPDGTEATNITQSPEIHFGPPAWSPDGRFLTFQGYALAQSDQPAIWLYELATEKITQVVVPGIQPTWLP